MEWDTLKYIFVAIVVIVALFYSIKTWRESCSYQKILVIVVGVALLLIWLCTL